MTKRSNPWPFSKRSAPAAPARKARRSSLTIGAAMRAAKEAGYRGKDFNEWIDAKHLRDRGPQVLSRFGQAYREGMDQRENDDRRKQDVKDAARAVARERAAAKVAKVDARKATAVKTAHEDKRLRAIDEKALQAHYAKGGTFNEFLAKMNPAKLKRCIAEVTKRNPAGASAEAFEEFHGYAPTEIVKVRKERHHHTHLAAAGDLIGLKVRPIGHGLAVRNIEGLGKAILAFNEKKNQLFIEGGDQSMSAKELKHFGISEEHELQTIGKLVGVGYFTDKTHLGDEGGEAVYSHRFRTTNENGRHIVVTIARSPDLIYRVREEQFEISGGSYTIRAEGIDV